MSKSRASKIFQSTLPRRERLSSVNGNLLLIIFQSTLPRRERRKELMVRMNGNFISIHAPAKGATMMVVGQVKHIWNFNPRSREGSDRECNDTEQKHQYFNPRSREGSDIIAVMSPKGGIGFQSTLPRRERPAPIQKRRWSI